MRVTNRVFQFIALGMIAASPALAQGGMAGMKHDDADKKVEGGGKLPAGWAARTDKDAPVSGLKFVKMGEGWHVTSGPAAVYYREADKASGNYKVSASFSAGKGQYPEGYGLVIGGSDLAGANQQYTYFLVRQDGKFLIKQRKGSSTSNVTSDWTDNAAVKQPGADGKATNELAVSVNGGKASFTVNGKEVYSTDASKIDTNGIVGLRVNHNLDVHVEGFAVSKS